jgi:hypothetical protein
MYQHLISNDILVDDQFGSKPKSSTMAVAFSLINEILEAFKSKQKNIVGSTFCDLKMAFHSVDCDNLL